MQLPLLQVRNLVLRGRPLAPLHDVDGVDLRRVHCRELDEVHRRQGSGLDPCDPCHAMPMPMPMPMPLVNLRQHLTSQHDFACFWNDVRSCTYLIKHLQLPRLGRCIYALNVANALWDPTVLHLIGGAGFRGPTGLLEWTCTCPESSIYSISLERKFAEQLESRPTKT